MKYKSLKFGLFRRCIIDSEEQKRIRKDRPEFGGNSGNDGTTN